MTVGGVGLEAKRGVDEEGGEQVGDKGGEE